MSKQALVAIRFKALDPSIRITFGTRRNIDPSDIVILEECLSRIIGADIRIKRTRVVVPDVQHVRVGRRN